MLVKRRQFTSRFKDKLAIEAMKGQRTIGELAGLYQVHPPRIDAWKRRLVECSAMTFEESSVQGSDHSPPALMAQLYEPTGRLQAELIRARSPQSKGANRAPARGDWESFGQGYAAAQISQSFDSIHVFIYICYFYQTFLAGGRALGRPGPAVDRGGRPAIASDGAFLYILILFGINRHALAHRPHSRRRTWGREPSQEWWYY